MTKPRRKNQKTDEKPSDTEKGAKWWLRYILVPIIIALLGAPILVIFFSSGDKLGVSHDKIIIQSDYYHIGDVEYVLNIKTNERTYFSHPSPQSNPFSKDFEIPFTPKSAILYLTARNVDPDEKTSPTKLFLNGNLIDLLNRYFTVETMDPKTISIVIDISFLHRGKNNIQIFVESNPNDFLGNVDDIEFWDMYLEIAK
jgi:hypothetical protein